MPKLDLKTAQNKRSSIENVSIRCFLKYGYHGVTIRKIAKEAKISTGNIYNYYPDKLTLFRTILSRLSKSFVAHSDEAVSKYLARGEFPDDLFRLADALKDNILKHKSYLKMVYIDVVEFDGRHVAERFSRLDEQFKRAVGKQFKEIPCFAFVSIYLQFHHFFVLTKVLNAQNPFGMLSEHETIQRIIDLFLQGIGTQKRDAPQHSLRTYTL